MARFNQENIRNVENFIFKKCNNTISIIVAFEIKITWNE